MLATVVGLVALLGTGAVAAGLQDRPASPVRASARVPVALPTVTASIVRPTGPAAPPPVTVPASPSAGPPAARHPTPGPRPTPGASPAASPSPSPGASGGPSAGTSAQPARPPVRAVPVPRALRPTRTLDFRVSTFNVLGASHTTAHGKSPEMASGRVRAHGAARLIARRDPDVVGFQELQASQLAVLQRVTRLSFYPGRTFGDSDNSIGWRSDRWVAVERHTQAIPYFAGRVRQMPYVLLRHRATGVQAWFANFHNPAETRQFHQQQRFRTEATRREIALANRLLDRTHLPVFITGDMNERTPYLCRLTARTPMRPAQDALPAASGAVGGGACRATQRPGIDWILGSQDVRFTDYTVDDDALVKRTTDHPVVTADVSLTIDPGLVQVGR